MIAMMRRTWNNLWFQPWGPENLSLSRLLVSGLFLWSHLSWDLSVWTEVSDAFWMPIPLFRALGLEIPSAAFVKFVQRIFLVSLTLGFVGLFTRTAFAVSFFSWLYVFGLRQSFGSIAPAEGHFILMFGVFAMSRCGDAFSIDSLIRRVRDRPDHVAEEVKRGSYSWPVRLMQLLFVSVFFASGVAKVRLGASTGSSRTTSRSPCRSSTWDRSRTGSQEKYSSANSSAFRRWPSSCSPFLRSSVGAPAS